MRKAPDPALPNAAARTNRRLDSIQYLRACAAVMVVVSHAANALLGSSGHLIDLDYGAYGVDLFFVVSGFIMFYTTFGTPMGPGTFLAKRLIRIFPLYCVLTCIMYLMLIVSPASFNKISGNALTFVESILFIPHWNSQTHALLQPILGPGWTLNYEMFFYLVFTACLFLGKNFQGLAAVPVIGVLVILGCAVSVDSPMFITYTDPLMLEFCFGIGVAALFLVSTKKAIWLTALMLAVLSLAAAALFWFDHGLHGAEPLVAGLPCAVLIAIAVAIERSGRLPYLPWLALIGDASYSLYLVHTFVLGFGQHLWRRFISGDSLVLHAVFILMILVLSIAAAIPLYRYFEVEIGKHLNCALRRMQSKNRVAIRHATR